ncbi:MAG: hypothetical protein ACKOHG_11120, partial [Planctomycetia bacterium]
MEGVVFDEESSSVNIRDNLFYGRLKKPGQCSNPKSPERKRRDMHDGIVQSSIGRGILKPEPCSGRRGIPTCVRMLSCFLQTSIR